MKTVVLITTGQPSVNPRIVKEADALHTAGYKVIVLYCFWIRWAMEADKKLLKNAGWEYRLIGGSPATGKIQYYFTKARYKINNFLNSKGYNKFSIAERSQARCYDELLATARSIQGSLYIGHNLGALSVAANAARYTKSLAGFDFEDYHRQENDNELSSLKARIVFLETKYVSLLTYMTSSSPLIEKKIKIDHPNFNKPIFTLLNCFPLSQQNFYKDVCKSDNRLQLLWFSQTVGKNRGLETVIAALVLLKNASIHLTLVGRVDIDFKNFINEHARAIQANIHFAGIIAPEELPVFASSFDVGLATELSTPLNRDICLTNKIFTYLLAGNCILASNTQAQNDFIHSYPGVGALYTINNVEELAKKISKLYINRVYLNNCKKSSQTLALTKMNWEEESKKLLQVLSSLI